MVSYRNVIGKRRKMCCMKNRGHNIIFVAGDSMNSKKICIVESHNEVLRPWSELRNNEDKAPILLTMDHHTDTHDAFLSKIFTGKELDYNLQEELLNRIDYQNVSSIEDAINNLKNDEHIATAIKANIINCAFVIAYDAGPGNSPSSKEEMTDNQFRNDHFIELMLGQKACPSYTRPYNYLCDDEVMYIPDWSILDGLDNYIDKDEFLDYVIDDSFLEKVFTTFGEMNRTVFSKPMVFNNKYILDIDLDYFSSIKSLKPEKTSIFYNLIRNAELITIAKEPECVKLCSNEVLTSEGVLSAVMKHIEKALAYDYEVTILC